MATTEAAASVKGLDAVPWSLLGSLAAAEVASTWAVSSGLEEAKETEGGPLPAAEAAPGLDPGSEDMVGRRIDEREAGERRLERLDNNKGTLSTTTTKAVFG